MCGRKLHTSDSLLFANCGNPKDTHWRAQTAPEAAEVQANTSSKLPVARLLPRNTAKLAKKAFFACN